jgi:hypothetical protein
VLSSTFAAEGGRLLLEISIAILGKPGIPAMFRASIELRDELAGTEPDKAVAPITRSIFLREKSDLIK